MAGLPMVVASLALLDADSRLALGLKDVSRAGLRAGFWPFHSMGNVTKPHS